jgi:hypothetical protein
MLLQELCTRSPRYAYRKELWIQPEALAKNPMFSTVSSFWKPPEYPLFQAQVLVRKKGKLFSVFHYLKLLEGYFICDCYYCKISRQITA